MQAGRMGRAIGGRAALSFAGALAGLALALTLGCRRRRAKGQEPSSSVRPPPGASIPGGPNVVQPERPGNYDNELWRQVREGLQRAGLHPRQEGRPARAVGRRGMAQFPQRAAAEIRAVVSGRHRRTTGRLLPAARPHLHRARLGRPDHHALQRSERFGHWLLAVSFVILALTGLNVLYGRYFLLPLIGAALFSDISVGAKWLHNYVAFAFMVGFALTFVVWLRYNFPSWRDVVWLAKGGGMFVRGSHPPAWKFNAGQKILFWLVMLGGLSLSLSGIALLFPFETALFAKTFAAINRLAASSGWRRICRPI